MNKKDYEMKGGIPLWGVYMPKQAISDVQDILKSKWLNTGKQEMLLRKKMCEKFSIPFCVAVCNCTAALRASLAMLGVGSKDEVISTPYTFLATNTSILEQGAKPVFADIKYDDLNIDPKSIEEKITGKTKAIMCVHYAGNPCDMDEIKQIARKNNLPVIEDCAHAIGSKYKGQFIGSNADIACFSFQVIKMITSGDGGVIATTNEEYYKKLKKIIWFGVDRENKQNRLLDPLPDDIDVLGFKYNMNDIVATLGIAGLDHFEATMKRRKEIGERYRREFAGCSRIKLIHYSSDKTPNYWIFPIHVNGREEFARHMQKYSIRVNVNNRRNDRYSIFGGKRDLPVTEKADNDVILIPIHTELTDNQVEMIIEAVKKYDRI